MESIKTILHDNKISGKDLTLEFVNHHDDIKEQKENYMTVIVTESIFPKNDTCPSFQWNDYWSVLKTKSLGRSIMFSEVITSTMVPLEM